MWKIDYKMTDQGDPLERIASGSSADMLLPRAVTMMALRLMGVDTAIQIDGEPARQRVFELHAIISYKPPEDLDGKPAPDAGRY